MTRLILTTALSLMLATTAALAADPAMTATTAKGPTLVDAKGMTLYTFDKDSAEKIACVDKCAANWPPFLAEAGAMASGDWTLVTRPEGAQQWAYKGKPLYAWVKDMKPGDITGDNFLDGAWHVAQP